MPSLAAAVEGVSFGIITTDPNGLIASWNNGASRLFGYSAEEVIGLPLARLERRDTPRSIASAYLDETLYNHKDGRAIDAAIEQSPIANEAGDLVGYLVIARPSVSSVRPRGRFAEIEAIARLGSFELDLRRDHAVWSAELYKIFGLDPRVFDPNVTDVIEYVHPADRSRMEDALRRCVQEGIPADLDYRVIRPDGETRVFSVRTRLDRDVDGRAERLVGVVQDLSERRMRERDAIVSDRFHTIAALGAGVAHEINSPLAAVVNTLDFAIREVEELEGGRAQIEEIVEALGEARQASRKIRDVVRDLKVFARGDHPEHREPVDVREVIDSAVHLVQFEVRNRARVVVPVPETPLFVHANRAELAVVFVNLLANALQSIPLHNVDHEIELALSATPERVIVAIRDTGIGIAPEHVDHIFEPFFTVGPHASRGLGLAICHAVITALGGTISLASTPNVGSTFRIELARTAAPIERARPRLAGSRRRRICVIDDDEHLLRSLARTLAREHDVVAISDPADALARMRGGERFDVILCDLMMPVLTGMDVHGEIEQLDVEQSARMIFMTGSALTGPTAQFLDAVPNPRLEKPFEISALFALIEEL